LITYILFILGFVFIVKGADMLVDGSASLAKRFNISNLVIGLTIVAFGTSMPELIVNLFASFQGNSDIAIGNILGSNIANILLILGIAAIIRPLKIEKNITYREIPYSLLAAVVLGFLGADALINGDSASILSRSDGLILLCFFAIFMYYIFAESRERNDTDIEIKDLSVLKSGIFIFAGIVGLGIGGKWVVDGAVEIAGDLGVSESFIGLTAVAIGTSLPELAASAVAAYKGNTDIAIGNVVGSNIFNIFWILGISSVIKPLPFSSGELIDLGMVIFVSILFFVSIFIGKRHSIGKIEGIFFLLLYIGYIVFLVVTD
jgi:cation:H+ antiporter